MEHLWGLGEMQLEERPAGAGFATVTSGIRVPGLCLEVGRENFGITIGYLNRQRLSVLATNAASSLVPPSVTPGFCSFGTQTNGSIWGFGHIKMRSEPAQNDHFANVTGKAIAGFGVSAGKNDNSLALALTERQTTEVIDRNIRVDFDQVAPRWPGFDLFTMKVNACTTTNVENKKVNP